MSIEWHSDALTYSDTIDFPIPEEYSYRASLYDVGGIPHNQFNGIYEFVGGAGNCALPFPKRIPFAQSNNS